MEQDEEELSLPEDTLKILNEFLLEKAQREQTELAQIRNKSGKEAKFEEDWQLSQFWYSETTKTALGNAVKEITDEHDNPSFSIALLSCPSLYGTVKEICENVKVFEYDKRFSAFGEDFVFYDFNEADSPDYLKYHKNAYDLIIADPPFLSEECIKKISLIIKYFKKTPTGKVIFCSGEIVEPWLKQNLKDLKKCNFRPEHDRNLGNEFACYANFDLDVLIGKID